MYNLFKWYKISEKKDLKSFLEKSENKNRNYQKVRKSDMPGLYVHIPFCQRKCFYCSFVVAVGKENFIDQYIKALAKEVKQYKHKKISTLYIGGGTPTVLNVKQLEDLFKLIDQNISFSKDIEITIEANPEGITQDKLEVLKHFGVNRISLGVQSLNDAYLSYLGRNHDSQKAIKTYQMIRDYGFKNINLDLMYGFPEQSLEALNNDIRSITALESDHLSLYSLMIEENSRFYTKKVQLPDPDIQADFYQAVIDGLKQRKFYQYEVSNFSKKGFESQHNLNYWKCNEYIGLGVGAHSFLNNKRFSNTSKFSEYIKEDAVHGYTAAHNVSEISKQELFKDAFLFGLRMNQGVDLLELETKFNMRLQENDQQQLNIFIQEKLLEKDGNYIKATDRGRLVLDELCSRLL